MISRETKITCDVCGVEVEGNFHVVKRRLSCVDADGNLVTWTIPGEEEKDVHLCSECMEAVNSVLEPNVPDETPGEAEEPQGEAEDVGTTETEDETE